MLLVLFVKPHLSQPLLRKRITTEVEEMALRDGFSAGRRRLQL